jgi:hypothetical protein
MKKLLTVSLILLVAVAVIGSSAVAKIKEAKKSIVQNESIVDNGFNNTLPKEVPSVVYATTTPTDGIAIGTTDYDYGFNSGGPREIAVNAENKVHLTFMERDLTQASPANRRSQKYVYWNGTAMVSGYPVAKTVGATGFGGIDAWYGGTGDNYAVWCAHTPNLFGMANGAGDINFTVTSMPTYVGPNDPEVTCDNARQIVWYYYTGGGGGRTNYSVVKSTDYGTTWIVSDTALMSKSPTPSLYTIGSLDVPVLVAPNGTLYLVTTISGADNGFPISNVKSLDSTDQIGYFKSTNAGTSWTWTRIGYDGMALTINSQTVYQLFENFGQLSSFVDAYNVLHVVANGYMMKSLHTTGGIVDSIQNQFGTLYWNSNTQAWKLISNVADLYYPGYDVTGPFVRNGFGFCYPTITGIGSNLFALWSQPTYNAANASKLDTSFRGYYNYDLWYTSSIDKGVTWTAATKWTNTKYGNGHFACAGGITKTTATAATGLAHVVYLADTASGSGLDTEHPNVQVNWIYRTVSIPTSTGVEGETNVPNNFAIEQNYPNPFNPSTTINYSIGTASFVSLKVYNIVGQEVASVVNEFKNAGSYKATFNASSLPSGVFTYRIQAGTFNETKKMILMK